MDSQTQELLSNNGKVNASEVKAPVILYYFSAHWCPPCRNFTPVLAELYKKWNANGKQIEIIFVTSDRDEKSFNEYFATMPWLAIPFGDPSIKVWKTKCEVSGIPTLAVIGTDGSVLTTDARDIVSDKKEDALAAFKSLYN